MAVDTASEEWLLTIACADLFLDEVVKAATAGGAEAASAYHAMLKCGVLEIAEDDDDDDDDAVVRELSLPSAPVIRRMLGDAVRMVELAVANGGSPEDAVEDLRTDLVISTAAPPAPKTLEAKACALAEATSQCMNDGDVRALRNAYGETLTIDDKKQLVDRSVIAGMSGDGESALAKAWLDDGATALAEGLAVLSIVNYKDAEVYLDCCRCGRCHC